MAKAVQVHTKHPNETRNLAIDGTDLFDDSETFTGTPTFAAAHAGLTFSSPQVSAGALNIRNRPVAIGKALQVSVSGGSAGVEYDCTATCGTTSSPAQTVVITFRLLVSDH